ncbi:MAG: inositol monophosphatase [Chloroflexaceae bacterium]|nr:inositol monophosphatase [Chloroflexaceae bacterium]
MPTPTSALPDAAELLARLKPLHEQIRDTVVAACEQSALEQLSQVASEDHAGDTIYAVDRVSEALLLDFFGREVAPRWPLVLIAEGLPHGEVVLPAGQSADTAVLRIIVDPIDGTRGLMYQKRSAWILTGVAPNRGPATSLRDITLALQTEIPLVKQHLCDMVWTSAGAPVQAVRCNRLTGDTWPITLRPSQATSIAHGFAMISRFFPGARDELAAIDEAVIRAVLGPPQPGRAHCFEDQYISTAGQLYELMSGHDRFVADLRPLLDRWLATRGEALGICCHPYDLATLLIAEQAGVLLTSDSGGPLNAPLDTETSVGWIGYANAAIRQQIEPALLRELAARGLIEPHQTEIAP